MSQKQSKQRENGQRNMRRAEKKINKKSQEIQIYSFRNL